MASMLELAESSRPPASKKRHKVALVIGSGGLKCMAAFGAIKVLQREGIEVDMIVACSGGALSGVWMAIEAGDPDEGAAYFSRIWQTAFSKKSYKSIFKAIFPKLFGFKGRFGIVDERAINRAMREFVGERRFEDLKIPLYLVATDFTTGEKVVLSEGSIFDAMRATISIPLVLPHWEVDGKLLVDGALSNPLPIDVAVREGADVIVAIGFEDTLSSKFPTGMSLVTQLISVMVNHLYSSQYAFYSLSHHAEVVPIIPTFSQAVSLEDLHLIPHLVEQGAQAAEGEIPYLRRLLSSNESQAV
jgi:NTE family protein